MASAPATGMTAYRAPSLFQPHRARDAIRDAHVGKIPPLLCFYCGLSTIPTARFIAPMGFDAVWVDWEHSSCNVETMTTMVHELMFMSEGKTIPFVRVPGHDHAAIGFALDAGASIVVPQVDTVEQAKHIVSAAKYGAKSASGIPGSRSAPPFRLIPGLTDLPINPNLSHHENMNEQAAIMIQIETLECIRNLDQILTEVPEIDVVWLGSLDARVSMGFPANMGAGSEPEWLEAVAHYEATIKKHNKPKAGFALGDNDAVKKMGAEKCFVAVASDVTALMGQLGELARARELCPPLVKETEREKVVVNGYMNGNANAHMKEEVVENGQPKEMANGHAKVAVDVMQNGVVVTE